MSKWLIVGSGGFIAPRHFESIKNIGDEVVGTCDVKSDTNPDFTDYKEMLELVSADAVAICTPNYLHYPMIQMALDKGLRVLCEKPLTLSSKEIEQLPNDGRVGAVLQLRYHPVCYLRPMKKLEGGSIILKVYRDDDYWASWKGSKEKSGGILFNLGVHYFDLLIYLLGNEYKIIESSYSDRLAKGKIDFNGSVFDYYIEIMDNNDGQDRRLTISGQEISLSKQDNLSYEGWHTDVYRDFKGGKVVTPFEACKSIKLIEKCIHTQQQ
ncbi:hypothetical protein LCGC14_1222210 [marine sediment metagenome]|uniref:Gfo/Idh/MocA-like oxidoreductase N-terminal domain-containing protein n=1 Tax=marine sediment metagenome TaxID=412755 RepID=A0A0F9LAZ8_9ZZZZ|nr:Gfo/Idh/MocA family oxidoreductase [Candidatus Scalindua sp.]